MARARTAPTIEFFWAEPDPDIVAQELLQLSYALEDFRAPLLASSQLVREDIRERFRTGTDPGGYRWERWSRNYWEYAEAHSTGPRFPDHGANLHLTGAMEKAVTSNAAWDSTEQSLFLDTSVLPEYWAWNNFGAERVRTSEEADDDPFGVQPNILPERPFVGLSPQGRAKVEAAFARWFEGTVQAATSPKGTPFFRHAKRGPGGRFVKG